MLIIVPSIFENICYLFADESSALTGEKFGGTGFLVHRRSESGRRFVYAGTNKHVIDEGFTTIRVNRTDGGDPDIISPSKLDWIPHKDGADVFWAYVDEPEKYCFEGINVSHFLRKDDLKPTHTIEPSAVNVGGDVYMVGRFSGSPGKLTNRPVVRSGIVSQFPDPLEPISYSSTIDPQEAFLVEMHSIEGFSGSPVFHTQVGLTSFLSVSTVLERFYNIPVPELEFDPSDNPIRLIGIDAGGCRPWQATQVRDNGVPYPCQYEVQSHSGFAIVIPCWKIEELLLQDTLAQWIQEANDKPAIEQDAK
ncbi:MAG: trypsin-like peptidase domain-containing protein [Acidobacteria bacterium]|nr:trypsin-like peptidase domain-containing protein [Acidobacteriota bacterium]